MSNQVGLADKAIKALAATEAMDAGVQLDTPERHAIRLDVPGGIDAWNTRAALRAAPEGFVMVPVKATDSMKLAAWKVWDSKGDKAHQVWTAMVAARPEVG